MKVRQISIQYASKFKREILNFRSLIMSLGCSSLRGTI